MAPLVKEYMKTSSLLMWPLTRRSGNTYSCKTHKNIKVPHLLFITTTCLAGAALLWIFYGGYLVFSWRGVPCAPCGNLLLPRGWQHLHHRAHSRELWDTTGKADQTPPVAQEWTWRALPLERSQPWDGPGRVWGQIPHHPVWYLY